MIRLVRRLFGSSRQPIGRSSTSEYTSTSRREDTADRTAASNPLSYFRYNQDFEQLLNKKLSIAEACRLFPVLERQTREEWSTTFTKFAYFVERLFDSARDRTLEQSYQLFIALTTLYKACGNRRSQNLTKIYNRLLADILSS